MQKVKEDIYIDIPRVKIYRDDIEEIVNRLSELSDDVHVKASDYLLDEIDELDKLPKKKSNSIEIRTYRPYFSISLDKSTGRISSSEKSGEAKLLAIDIMEILNKRKIFHLYYWPIFYTLMVLTMISPSLSVKGYIEQITGIGVLILFALYGSLFLYKTTLKRNVVHYQYQKDVGNFFERNKDDLVINFIYLVVGSGLTFLGMYLYDKFMK